MKADQDSHCMSAAWSQESQFQEEPWVLLVHSPLLQQSRLLAVPPLSDMLKFGGSFHVRQVTDPQTGPPHKGGTLPFELLLITGCFL